MRTTSKQSIVNSSGSTLESFTGPLEDYVASNKDESMSGGTSYYGFLKSNGDWYIQRVTTTDLDFAFGISDYSSNWTGRSGLTYQKFDQF